MSNPWDQGGYSPGNDHLFGQFTNNSCVPDLKTGFEDLINGVNGCEGIGQIMVLRKMDLSKPAHGFDELYGGSTTDPWDQDELFQWTEEYLLGYFTQNFARALSGLVSTQPLYLLGKEGIWDNDKALIYLKAEAEPKNGDAIFRLKMKADGTLYYPTERIEKWRVAQALDRRQEHAVLAFWICLCKRVEV